MAIDHGYGTDKMGVGVGVPLVDGAREETGLKVQKWDADQVAYVQRRHGLVPGMDPTPFHFNAARVKPYEVGSYRGNLITREGWTLLLHGKTLLSTDSVPTLFFDTTHGRIGIGTSNTAAVATDTALGSIAAMTGNNWILCAAAPTVTTTATPSTVVFVATFASTDAVGAWNEFAVDQGTAATASTARVAPMINHSAGIAQGTKASGQVWTATATLSFT